MPSLTLHAHSQEVLFTGSGVCAFCGQEFLLSRRQASSAFGFDQTCHTSTVSFFDVGNTS